MSSTSSQRQRSAANMSSTSSQRGYPAQRPSANMSSTSSQCGYPDQRSAANMSSTSSQRGYPAQRPSANMSSTSSQHGYPAQRPAANMSFTSSQRGYPAQRPSANMSSTSSQRGYPTQRPLANMSSTSSQHGYPDQRSAANMSSTSSQRGYPAQRPEANMSSTSSRRGYPARKSEPWTRLTHRERRPQWIAYNPRTMRPPPLSTDTNSMKILSWNVNGLQTIVQSGFSAYELIGRENFDVLCLQETHLEESNVDLFKNLIPEYDYTYWSCSVARLGYSGTAVISRVQPISVQYGLGIPEHDQEGRLITLEFDEFYLVNAYVPNSGRDLRRLNYRVNDWDPCFSDFIKKLERSKPVIVAGDLNCARQSIDIHNPPAKTEAAGFTIEERESFEENFSSNGLIDTFRKQHPNAVAYTFWGENQRITNKGWRLDYFLASESIADKVHDSYTLPDVSLSDHSPIGLVLKL